jgi:pimeloyl-ACP methyl ester carboxylesterase
MPADARPSPQLEPQRIRANGLDFSCIVAGAENAPAVVLLHGFPEIAFGWRHQIPALAAAGLRVIAPDQRGYGRSSKPDDASAYAIDLLAEDVLAIAASLGHDRFAVVGHDWGGIVAWHLAGRHAAHVRRLAILNAPNLDVLPGYALHHPAQLLRSSYVAAFQVPLLPELALAAANHALLSAALTSSSRPGTFTSADLDVYRDAWSQPGSLTAMLNWYRASARSAPRQAVRIEQPVLVIWGDRDVALQPSLADASAELCDDVDVVHLATAGHWVQHEEASRVNELLVAFLEQAAAAAPSPPERRSFRSPCSPGSRRPR